MFSLLAVTLSFVLCPEWDVISLAASLVGVTALILVARGDVLGQLLLILFSLLYAIVSFRLEYYGEMITYLLMSAPMAVVATVSWLRNPYQENKNEVRVASVTRLQWFLLVISNVVVTIAFYFILSLLGTSNLLFSTLSISTSFFAAALTYLRSPYYGLGYAANDIVLIVLWALAAAEDIRYLPMILCFSSFLLNDVYGFWNWQKMKKRQSKN